MPVLSVAEILPGATLGLFSGIDDILVLDFNGTRVLYALNRAENRVLEVSLSATGQMTFADSLQFAGTVAAGTEPRLTEGMTASGDVFLTVSGLSAQDGQTVTLSPTGALGTQAPLTGVGMLDQAVPLAVGASSVLVSADGGGGLLSFWDDGQGYSAGPALADTADRYLADISGTVQFLAGGVPYVATVSATEHGVNVASVQQSGLTHTGAIGATDTLPISVPEDIAAVTQFGETWLFVASQGTSSLSVLRVADGVPHLADHVYDNAVTRFQGASEVAAATYGDMAYVAVGGAEGGISLFTMLHDGRLVHLDSVAEDETVPLNQIAALEMFATGTTVHVVVGSGNEVGLTRLTYDMSQSGSVVSASSDGNGATGTSLDDQIVGSVAGEALSGLAGDDILVDGLGNDTLTGGSGADLFVLTADGQGDTITDFERGSDRLDMSAFDFLYDVSQVTIAPTATGATLTFGDETLHVTTADLTPLTAGSLTTQDILNLDRPPFLSIGREISGTESADLLNGGPGADTISGLGGDDRLVGGPGLDVLLGNAGNDTLEGEGAEDTLYGGLGDDLLFGGDSDDLIYGDDWA